MAPRSTRALGSKMNPSFVASTLQSAPATNMGGVIANGSVSTSVEAGFAPERARSHCSRLASLGWRLPQRRLPQRFACVDRSSMRVGQSKRSPTSGIPDRTALGPTRDWRALASASRSAPVRPNYAFERSVMDFVTKRRDSSGYLLGAKLRDWCPAQRER